MQIGLITIDGRQVGNVTMTYGDDVDTASPVLGVDEHQGRDWRTPLGLPPVEPAGPDRHIAPRAPLVRDHGHAAHLGDRAQHHTTRAPLARPAAANDGVGDGLAGSAYLSARRQRFAQEMRDNPGLRDQVAGMLLTEGAGDPVPVAESLMNRLDYAGGSIHGALHSGFYGPINRGELPAAMEHLRRDQALNARMNRAIDAALNGSNIIRGATDQGLPTDPNGRWQGGRMTRGGNVFNDWGSGPGGHEGSRAYRENLMRHVEQEHAQAENVTFDPDTMAP